MVTPKKGNDSVKSTGVRRNQADQKPAITPPPPTFPPHKYLSGNALVCGDNMDVLGDLPDECIDLIYLDPPFNSNHNYVAVFGDKGSVDPQLRDIWRWTVESENAYQRLPHDKLLNAINGIRLICGETSQMSAYAIFMGRRLLEMRRVLKPTGSIYLHCDPTARGCRQNSLLQIITARSWQIARKVKAPMSLMVTLYPPRETLRVYAAQQGQVTLSGERYPKMQVLSIQEMLTKMVRPKLPPVDPRYFVGNTQTRFAMVG